MHKSDAVPSELVSKLKTLKQIRRGVGKEVLSSKKLKQLGASLRRQLSIQLKIDYRIAGVSKGRPPYSHCQAKRRFEVFL